MWQVWLLVDFSTISLVTMRAYAYEYHFSLSKTDNCVMDQWFIQVESTKADMY